MGILMAKYKHPRGHFAKRKTKKGVRYYGNSRRLTLKQIRAYQWKRHHG